MEKKHSKEQIRLTVSVDYLMQDYKKEEKRFTQDVDLFFCMWEKSAVKIRKIKWGRDFNKN